MVAGAGMVAGPDLAAAAEAECTGMPLRLDGEAPGTSQGSDWCGAPPRRDSNSSTGHTGPAGD